MQFRIIFIVFVLALNAQAVGFSGRPVEVACPICSKPFISKIVEKRSLFYWGRCETCPYCLYTAIGKDFKTPTPEEVVRIREALGDLRPALEDLSRELLGFELEEVLEKRGSIAALIGMECYRHRAVAIQPPAPLARWAHYLAERNAHEEIVAAFRKLAISRFEEGLSRGVFPPDQSPQYTLLLGEIYMLDGDTDRALTLFDRARELVAQSPEPESFNYIHWGIAQHSAAIAVSDMTTAQLGEALSPLGEHDLPHYERNLAYRSLRELYRRDDADAWAVIVRGSTTSPRRLRALLSNMKPSVSKLQRYSELWQYMEEVYAAGDDYLDLKKLIECAHVLQDIEGGDPRYFYAHTWAALRDGRLRPILTEHVTESELALEELASRCRTAPERLRELNEVLAHIEIVPAGSRITCLNTPAEWYAWRRNEDRVLQAMRGLIQSGETLAVDYFVDWLQTADRAGVELMRAMRWLDAIRNSPELWPVFRAASPTFSNETQEVVWDCLLLSCGSEAENDQLYARAKPRFMSQLVKGAEWNQVYALIIGVMERQSDDSAKAWALRQSTHSHTHRITPYLSAVCNESDIPEIERVALSLRGQEYGKPRRAYIEGVIRNIHLRKLETTDANSEGASGGTPHIRQSIRSNKR